MTTGGRAPVCGGSDDPRSDPDRHAHDVFTPLRRRSIALRISQRRIARQIGEGTVTEIVTYKGCTIELEYDAKRWTVAAFTSDQEWIGNSEAPTRGFALDEGKCLVDEWPEERE